MSDDWTTPDGDETCKHGNQPGGCEDRTGTRWCASDFLAWDIITPNQRDILTAPIRAALPDLWADVSAHLPD